MLLSILGPFWVCGNWVSSEVSREIQVSGDRKTILSFFEWKVNNYPDAIADVFSKRREVKALNL